MGKHHGVSGPEKNVPRGVYSDQLPSTESSYDVGSCDETGERAGSTSDFWEWLADQNSGAWNPAELEEE